MTVTSGKQQVVHCRFACDKLLRQHPKNGMPGTSSFSSPQAP
jgi:hypothetical protein